MKRFFSSLFLFCLFSAVLRAQTVLRLPVQGNYVEFYANASEIAVRGTDADQAALYAITADGAVERFRKKEILTNGWLKFTHVTYHNNHDRGNLFRLFVNLPADSLEISVLQGVLLEAVPVRSEPYLTVVGAPLPDTVQVATDRPVRYLSEVEAVSLSALPRPCVFHQPDASEWETFPESLQALPDFSGMCPAEQIEAIERLFGSEQFEGLAPVRQMRELGGYDWNARHEAVLARNAAVRPDVLMVGNSITHYWAGEPVSKYVRGADSWDALFAGRRVTNMGFGWDRIENVVWRILHGELDNCSPRADVFMLIGTNNLVVSTDEEIARGVVALARLVRTRLPEARIHVLSLLPRRGFDSRIAHINNLLQQFVPAETDAAYVDMTAALTDAAGHIDETLFNDGLHPNAKGYWRMAAVLEPYVKHAAAPVSAE